MITKLFPVLIWIACPFHFAVADDCACQKVTCNSECEYEAEMTFYSEKCAGGERVKSCSKPKCLLKSDAPVKCRPEQDTAKNTSAQSPLDRDVASEKVEKPIVGKINF